MNIPRATQPTERKSGHASGRHSICFSESSKENQAPFHHSCLNNMPYIGFCSFLYSSSSLTLAP